MAVAEPPKSVRYDRQLRLWGEEGQRALEESRICLLNATAVGTETLKNLVLPGIGGFTIVDPSTVEAADLGRNFFVDASSLGKSRAEVTANMLRELNPHVDGKYRSEVLTLLTIQNPVQLIETNIEFFSHFTLVITTRIPEKPLLTLAAFLWAKSIPLVVATSLGFLGSVRIALPEHTIIQSNPDTPIEDLRIVNPFPALVQYNNSFNLPALAQVDRGNVPFSVVLYQFVEKWKQEHDGQNCKTYQEKNQLRAAIQAAGILETHLKGLVDNDVLENYEEASKSHLKFAYAPPYNGKTVPGEAENLTKHSTKYWILVAALKRFVSKHGVLPLPGALPDMHASNANYIGLQQLFSGKAHEDLTEIGQIVEELCGRLQIPNEIDQEQLKIFCKNTANLRLVRYRALAEEYGPTHRLALLQPRFEQPDDNTIWSSFLAHSQEGRYPGSVGTELDVDTAKLRHLSRHLSKELTLAEDVVKDDYLQEVVRYGGAELHNISAFMGGIIAQEIIKLATHQYVPVNNTFIFNGLNSSSTQVEL